MGSSARNSSGVHCAGAASGSTRFRRRFRRFRRRVRRRFRRRCGRLWCRARLSSTGVRRRFRRRFREALVQSQVKFNRICGHLIHGNPAEVFPALGFAAPCRKICKNKTLRLLGIPPKLIFWCLVSCLYEKNHPLLIGHWNCPAIPGHRCYYDPWPVQDGMQQVIEPLIKLYMKYRSPVEHRDHRIRYENDETRAKYVVPSLLNHGR